ncbi:single-stranded DNA-binding protein [Novosphingobium pentaromativorans]|uniref:Single-stranded DNA-binding protein n=1 Tax=Novosphingobium pentaromativorans US6-1 TaxID=1088721 RepID=G6E7G1_9SPHN|nr:single-stranded DNA-binding protein [Novosphingobium pentaromativorans US6-1]EHJ62784.1 single-stranded DNA-binding protein [Novosphingobium pentaromativorans US6-1]
MASVNKVILVGNLGADPEVKSFQNGGRIALMRIATSESWKDRNTGERQERTEWHSISVQSEGLVGVVERYLRKGSKIYVEGQLRTRKWQDQNGNDRYSTEVVLAGPRAVLVMLDGAQGNGGGRDDWGGNQQRRGTSRGHGQREGDRELYNSAKGGWQDDQSRGGGGRNDWGNDGGFGDDLDDDIPFITDRSIW